VSNKERPLPDPEPISERETTPTAEVFTLAELAERHGQTFSFLTREGKKVTQVIPDSDPYRLDHMLACTAHGWIPHEHHYGLVKLSDDDYLKALEAAKNGRVHAPANKRPKK
jgi:hypothetical protein